MQPDAVTAAEWALLAMASRAVLARAVADHPEVAALATRIAIDPNGGSTFDAEFLDRSGNAIAGHAL